MHANAISFAPPMTRNELQTPSPKKKCKMMPKTPGETFWIELIRVRRFEVLCGSTCEPLIEATANHEGAREESWVGGCADGS